MGKIRVHDLAKKLNMTNQELITKLTAKGIVVKTHSSSLDEAQAMIALQTSVSSDSNLVGSKPRTVLRRRRSDEVESAQRAVRDHDRKTLGRQRLQGRSARRLAAVPRV